MAVLGGEARSAEAWREDGLVAWTSPADALTADVDAWFARTLARHSAESLRYAVRAVRAPLAAAVGEPLAEAERLYLQDLMVTDDAVEGVQAFLEKRAPRWKDE
jgi:enoyl-CoA hydratase/carnithine racemase